MREVINSYSLPCRGAGNSSTKSVDASISVFETGARQVGCTQITSLGECTAGKVDNDSLFYPKCIHLFPVDSLEVNSGVEE